MRTPILLCLGFAAGAALADVTVYRSVDANGTVSYSDRPPQNAAALPIRIDADDPVPSPEVVERREAMRALTDQLQSERLEREQQRAELAAAMQQEQQYEQPDYYAGQEDVPIYYPARAYRPRPPWWSGQPLPPPQIPRPNPQSASPRGLIERIRQQY